MYTERKTHRIGGHEHEENYRSEGRDLPPARNHHPGKTGNEAVEQPGYLAAGYFYDPNGRSYYGAIYQFTTGDHTCEGDIKLVSISDETFIDNGHAIAWAMSQAN